MGFLWRGVARAGSGPVLPGEPGPGSTLTWINGGPPDKSVVERHLPGDPPGRRGGVAIHAPAQDTLDNWGPDVVGWSAAPEGLEDILAESGVSLSTAGRAGELDRPRAENRIAVPERAIAGLVALSLLAGLVGTLATPRSFRREKSG